MHKFTAILALLFLSLPFLAQNGKLIEQTEVVFPDSVLQEFSGIAAFSLYHHETDLHRISYLSDDLVVTGYIAQPKVEGVFPVIIFNRGGNRDFGALDDIRANFLLRKMASWGYIVVASNYRGGGGSEGMEEFGGADVNDIHNLIPFLANEERADTSRIGIYGHSRGGLMTYKVLQESCEYKAAIVGAGLANSVRCIKQRPEMEEHVYSELVPDYEINKEQVLHDRSAVFWADELCKTTPLMIMHGSSDWRVSPEDALDMATELYKINHPFRLHFYEGGIIPSLNTGMKLITR